MKEKEIKKEAKENVSEQVEKSIKDYVNNLSEADAKRLLIMHMLNDNYKMK